MRQHHRIALFVVAAAVTLACTGCPPRPSAPAAVSSPAKRPLQLLLVDDQPLGEAIAREWRSRTEEEITVKNISASELAGAKRLPADVVIFPSGQLGLLAERGLILPLEAATLEDSQLDYRDIFSLLRMREMKWGPRTFAVTLGSPQFLLAYRQDVFQKLGLSPPSDWVDYQRVIEQLADRQRRGEGAESAAASWQPAAEPLADGWAGQILLARAAAYALHRDQVSPLFQLESGVPLIAEPPYARALEELAAAAKAGGFASQRWTPAESMQALLDGRCAMALTWPSAPAQGSAPRTQESQIGFQLLPGGKHAYRFATKSWEDRPIDEESRVPLLAVSGRLAAISTSTADPRRAQGFVIWLAGREASAVLSTQSAATTLFRQSHVKSAASPQYGEVLSTALSLPRSFPNLRGPGRHEFLAALDQAVQEAAAGNKSPPEALREAAAKWPKIIDDIGLDSHRRANSHNLGQE